MTLAERISEMATEIRQSLNYDRGVGVRVIDAFEDENQTIHVILPDRAEKSLMLGPRGRIAAEIAKQVGKKLTFHGEDELLVRKHRLNLVLKRIEEVSTSITETQFDFLSVLRQWASLEQNYPYSSYAEYQNKCLETRVAVAFSGGVDSGTTLLLAKRVAGTVYAITVSMGPQFITPAAMENIKNLVERIGAEPEFVFPKHDMLERDSAHPCRRCHHITMEAALTAAERLEADVFLTGELLPTGRQSILCKEDILIAHLPAALAFTKYRTKSIMKPLQTDHSNGRFGCEYLSKQHHKGWRMTGPSVFRVLRELQGGILTTGEALSYIKSITRPLRILAKKTIGEE